MLMSFTYDEYSYLLEGNILSEEEKSDFKTILARKGDVVLLTTSIKQLVKYLCKYHNKEIILLIDEYDVPIQAGYVNNYYKNMMLFMRNALRAVLKDNDFIKKAMLTGILRVAKESIFSGMNNLEVYTLLNESFSDKFGFT